MNIKVEGQKRSMDCENEGMKEQGVNVRNRRKEHTTPIRNNLGQENNNDW